MRLTKGSAEAKAWGERMKASRKPKANQTAATDRKETTDEIKLPAAAEPEKKRRTARFAKGTAEAKEHMAKLRSLKKRHQ
jgi:hypothetical protein